MIPTPGSTGFAGILKKMDLAQYNYASILYVLPKVINIQSFTPWNARNNYQAFHGEQVIKAVAFLGRYPGHSGKGMVYPAGWLTRVFMQAAKQYTCRRWFLTYNDEIARLASRLTIMTETNIHPSVKGMRTTSIGIIISIILVFIKITAGKLGNSYALIADGTETATDVLSSGLLWIGLRISLKPPDKEHPYGHGKAEPLAAITISLFLVGAAISIGWNAIEFIQTPHQLPKKFTLGILLVVILIKESLFRYVLKVGTEINSQAVISDAYHHRSDAITSIAAFTGITIALILGKGYESADDWAALLASVIIIYNAVLLIKPALAEIMDAAPSNEIVQKVRLLAEQVPAVKQIEKCYVRKMGFDYYVDLHIQVTASLSVEEGHKIAHLVKARLLQGDLRIKDALIHIEPYGITE